MKKQLRFTIITFLLVINHNSFSQDIKGKVITGYQGWFSAQKSGNPNNKPDNKWRHWSNSSNSKPDEDNITFDLYPDIREYASNTLESTDLSDLGNGESSKLFSSWNNNIVDKHLEWMQNYGIDGLALQRFGNELSDLAVKQHRDDVAVKVKNAAQTYKRKFYIMYDISGWYNSNNANYRQQIPGVTDSQRNSRTWKFVQAIKDDWNDLNDNNNLTNSSAYAKEDSKPVICLWGFGEVKRPGGSDAYKDVINWFKNKGFYVILGVHKEWNTHETKLREAYKKAHMISPWFVGSFTNSTSSFSDWSSKLASQMNYCNTRNLDYQPVIFAGFSFYNKNRNDNDPRTKPKNEIPRNHGDFLWKQFLELDDRFDDYANLTKAAYIAMFDEYDEGTAIMKAAEDDSMAPTNEYFLTLDADGTFVSSDYYLRLVGDGARMLKGDIDNSNNHPTLHTLYLDDCEHNYRWSSGNGNSLSYDKSNKKQGTASIKMTGNSSAEFYRNFSSRPYNPEVKEKNGVLEFWYYADANQLNNIHVELSSETVQSQIDQHDYEWVLNNLNAGWNKIELPLVDANKSGSVDLSSIKWFRIFNTSYSGNITTKLDGVRITGYLDDCDTISSEWTSQNTLSTSGTKKQGLKSLKSVGGNAVEFKKTFPLNSYNAGHMVTETNGILEFWYRTDSSQRSNIRVELGSNTNPDSYEYEWTLTAPDVNVWKKYRLHFSTATKQDGGADLSKINTFRLFNTSNSGTVTSRIDGLRTTTDDYAMSKTSLKNKSEASLLNKINVFPNPAKNFIKVNINQYKTTKAAFTIYDLTGRSVYKESFNALKNDEFRLNTSTLKAGIYLLDIQLDTTRKIKRISIK